MISLRREPPIKIKEPPAVCWGCSELGNKQLQASFGGDQINTHSFPWQTSLIVISEKVDLE